jgi:hypothetical protein
MKPLLSILLLAGPLLACTVLPGDRILGADLAGAHPGFSGIDPGADIGPAPAAGARRTFRSFELERIAKENALALSADAPQEVCFERATRAFDEETLAAILRTVLDSQPRTAGVTFEIADFSRNPLPIGTPEFPLDGLSESGLWRGRLVYGDNRSIPIWVRVRIVRTPSDGAGTAKPVAMFREPAALGVLRGDTVRVEVLSGTVRLAFDAAAESSGHIGEQVTLRNPASGQRFRAVVASAGRVEIHK